MGFVRIVDTGLQETINKYNNSNGRGLYNVNAILQTAGVYNIYKSVLRFVK